MISFQLHHGDCRKVLSELCGNAEEKGKYRLIITSPPYYGHRHYGSHPSELGQEKSEQDFIEKLISAFETARELLTDDGSIWIVLGDTRRKMRKLMIPHRLAMKLVEIGYTFREDVIWYKKNNVSSSSKENLSQAFEYILFLSKYEKSYTNMDMIRVRGNEAREGRNKAPPPDLVQYQPLPRDDLKIEEIENIIHDAKSETPFEHLPSTSEISWAFGYDPDKFCPTCYRKFKRHATRKRIGDHKHYPIFAVCNPTGKNPGNVWEISTKAHYGNEHFAIFPEDLVARIMNFASQKGDWVLDPFMGRGTTGIVCALTNRNFTGIDLYEDNIKTSNENIMDAIKGKYDAKLVRDITREFVIENPRSTRAMTLESYLQSK